MKNFLPVSMLLLMVVACNPPKPSSPSTEMKSNDSAMAALYEKNLASLKAGIAAFESENADAWSAVVSDSAIYVSPIYGDRDSTKAHWQQLIMSYWANWDSLRLINPIFLPGIDQQTHELDGSVRYYGGWSGVHKSGKHTLVGFYGTYEFNADGKIISAAEFFDAGGVLNAVTAK
jgi:hypothetical protein